MIVGQHWKTAIIVDTVLFDPANDLLSHKRQDMRLILLMKLTDQIFHLKLY